MNDSVLPMGHLLARELGERYVSIGMTHTAGSVPHMRVDDCAAGFSITTTTLGPPAPTSVEAAATAAGLRTATLVRTRGVPGLGDVDRVRAQDGWSHTRLVDAFDGIVTVPTATVAEPWATTG